MKIIVGLGNPGEEYKNTRHNVGFDVIDKLAVKLNADSFREKFKGEYVKTDDFILAKPLTYMNNSGDFVYALMQFYKLNIDDLIVVYDDMDHPVGKAVIKTNGSAGGHNGMKDIIDKLGTSEIKRLKVGIGRPIGNVKNYVLSKFNAEHQKVINEVENRCVDVLETCIFNDIRYAITKFNTENK
ncbi:aminoacyl-tRNA hydrolase [[Mycoplasma] gypis]|uniref:Peptidyl-tRNA hydrolase n=1 Tax=[Mycoplasma] gypis TaxID=92404 RepID=A0ABZ2RMW5_9BACT|nr:aminoacyl-tRNA hydrolase [[Mycoplasma] gypis]MBN0919525.1 aminoacyl-tRNA hydrolase [[Mycoplasma] gypis]